MVDVGAFIEERRGRWRELEALLGRVEAEGLGCLDVEQARLFGRLYRGASSDLIQARSLTANAEVLSYLNDLVARSYGQIYTAPRYRLGDLKHFYAKTFPSLLIKHLRAVMVSAVFLVSGVIFGFAAISLDQEAHLFLSPPQHLHLEPRDRVAQEEKGSVADGGTQFAFSSFLFTHNIQVTFLVFCLGITFGAGTALVLLLNGVMLGAVAAAYHQNDVALFFYAWILPHGVLELTAVVIAGGAGLVMGWSLLSPGRKPRLQSLKEAAVDGVKLIFGAMPILVVAGLIEGTISQIHEPYLSYPVKIAFAIIMALGLAIYLCGGRWSRPEEGRA